MQGITALEGKHDDQSLRMVGDMISNYLQQDGASSNNGVWKPAYDISDTDDALVICLDVPGVDENSISIDVDDHYLDISGERNPPFESNSRCCGVLYGEFEQRIKMPVSVLDPNSAQVSLNNGVLRITIDKTLEKRSKFSLRVNRK